jgi:hypothetical protein
MKKIIIVVVLLALIATMFAACKKPKDPVVVEEELITTVKLKVTDSLGAQTTFVYKVQNGFGSTVPGTIQNDTVKLHPNSIYTYEIQVLEEAKDPVEDITSEIISEKDEHLFIFVPSPPTGAGSVTQFDGNKDNNNLPFNQSGKLQTGDAGHGALTLNLMHEPTNKNGNTPAASGGSTDAEVPFHVLLQ